MSIILYVCNSDKLLSAFEIILIAFVVSRLSLNATTCNDLLLTKAAAKSSAADSGILLLLRFTLLRLEICFKAFAIILTPAPRKFLNTMFLACY